MSADLVEILKSLTFYLIERCAYRI